jgi:hypothetical protein
MARYRGICGFEAGDYSGLSSIGGVAAITLSAANARSGNYRLNTNTTVAAKPSGAYIVDSFADPASGDYFDFRLRFFYKVQTLPSVSGCFIGGFESACLLQMDTAGALRLSHFGVTTAYTGATTVGQWYRAECRFFGLWTTAGKDNSGRYRSTIDIYDATNAVVASLVSADQVGLFADVSCSAGTKSLVDISSAFVTVAAKITSYKCTVSGAGAFNGDYATPITENLIQGGACGGGSAVGTYIEHGTLLGLDANQFKIINSFGTRPDLLVGQSFSGITCTRNIDYDDCYFDLRTAAEATGGLTEGFPAGTSINIFAVTGQGSLDQFSPAGAFADVAEIPLDGAAQITSNTLDNTTTYLHANLAGTYDKCYHIRVYANAVASASHKILIGTTEFSFVFSGATAGGDSSTNKADLSYQSSPLIKAQFDAQGFGAKIGTGGNTLTLRNILMEALTGPGAAPIEEDVPTDAFALSRALGFSLGNQGVEVNAPASWRIERLDIGPRVEERS